VAILAFGDNARAWARRFDDVQGEFLIADPTGASSAFLTAIETKKRGDPVVAAIAIDDPRSALAWALSGMVLNRHRYRDERMQALEEIGMHRAVIDGKPMSSMSTLEPRALETLRDFAKLADVLVVRSRTEATRVTRLLGVEPATIRRVVPTKPLDVPAPKAGAGKVVIWAPDQGAAQLGLLVYGLIDLHLPIAVVCKTGSFRDPSIEMHRAQNAAAILPDATLIVDASLSDPHDAIALAQQGYRVVTASTSGAHEYLEGLATYLPWMRRSIREAVLIALGRDAATCNVMVSGVSASERSRTTATQLNATQLRTNGPLASIIVRTYNRPRFLERALSSIAVQKYKSVEAVVVNDAGDPVDEIVAKFPFARLVVNEKNLGTTPSANVGLGAASGEYVGLLDDDDMLFPDHLSRHVDALERSGGAASSSDAITSYLELTPFSDYACYGYRVAMARHIDRSDIYVRDPVAPMAVLMRRRILEDLGGFEESVDFAEDWELWIRIAERYDILHVPHVTGIYSVRTDATNTVVRQAARFGDAFARIVELHPLQERPQIDAMRKQLVEQHRGMEMTPRWGEPAIRFEPPRPLP
jgi:hypothetical protein